MQKPILRHQHEPRRTHGYPPPPPPPAPSPRFVSAREAYPSFLSFQDTLGLQVSWAGRGLVDAFRWDIVVRLIARNVGFPKSFFFFSYLRRRDSCSDAEVRANALKSFMLNGISLLSIFVFDLFLQPLTQEQPPQKWLHRSVGWFYRVLWLLPVVGVSLYLNVRTRTLKSVF